jgi:uncharacterized protein YdeI (YjbR/CyaY-like superfamily)
MPNGRSPAATDPRIDAYIGKAQPFARPILEALRARVHAACPDAVETLKWSAPAFTYKGKILAVMAAFKQHAAFNLWHGAQVAEGGGDAQGMGQFGKLASVDDLPSKRDFAGLVKAAMKLIDAGESGGRKTTTPKPTLDTPDDLAAELARNAKARETFEGFPPGKRREYIEWLVEAKREDTRKRRLAQAVEWMSEGKSRHWKYRDC